MCNNYLGQEQGLGEQYSWRRQYSVERRNGANLRSWKDSRVENTQSM